MSDAFAELTPKIIALRGRMQERIDRIMANVDMDDADQVALANKELDVLFADGRREFSDLIVGEIISVMVVGLLSKILSESVTSDLHSGGVVSDKFIEHQGVYAPNETVMPRSVCDLFKKPSKR